MLQGRLVGPKPSSWRAGASPRVDGQPCNGYLLMSLAHLRDNQAFALLHEPTCTCKRGCVGFWVSVFKNKGGWLQRSAHLTQLCLTLGCLNWNAGVRLALNSSIRCSCVSFTEVKLHHSVLAFCLRSVAKLTDGCRASLAWLQLMLACLVVTYKPGWSCQ